MKVVITVDIPGLENEIKQARTHIGLSLNDLSRRFDMSAGNIQRIETGINKTVPLETLLALTEVLEIDVRERAIAAVIDLLRRE